MGIEGLWKILEHSAQRVDFVDYTLVNGFLPKYPGSRVFHVGIDASVLLDGYSAANITYGRFQHHTTVDASLTQLWRFLNQLSYAPTDCTFVYDGNDRASSKRGVQVITEEPLLYKKSKEMVQTFGFRVYTAKGDAEAELAIMNQKGLIDAVLTKDSDVFPLGAEHVLRISPEASSDSKLVVDLYDAKHIEDSLMLTTGGLILYSLLAGNDINAGVRGFGPVNALAIAQCGFGNSLVEAMAGSPTQQQQYLRELVCKIISELKNNTQGVLQHCYPAVAQTLLDSDFPSQDALDWFLKPPNSWSDSNHMPNTAAWVPRGHNYLEIMQFCRNNIGWSVMRAQQKFHKQLWRGVIIRMLCSKYLKYDSLSGLLLAPLLQKEFFEDSQGRPWAITNKTLLKGKNPPNLAAKGPGDVVRITFDISDFVETTLYYFPLPQGQETESELPKTLSVSVPFAIIATATGQHNLLPDFSSLIPCPNPHPTCSGSQPTAAGSGNVIDLTSDDAYTQPTATGSGNVIDLTSNNDIEISEVRPIKRRHVPTIDLT